MNEIAKTALPQSPTDACGVSNVLEGQTKRPFIVPKVVFVPPKLTKQGSIKQLTTEITGVSDLDD